ncbi:MAG: ATP-binding cassette domain-containing protein [Peptoniphilus sp.]|uniref:ABC transporter ATP-binding protein n=1 Tax=Peptoniphilus sp. TaxID=1971214 RepID=UPI002A74AEA4|nr:ATP-binding cassette domain-containing protein [Peptoniphilus sp.]MDY2986666.1 ATP-binding cassette domain-containing protein [Peptoniphilus sp.]
MIKLENVCFSYDKTTPIIKNLSLELDENEILGIVAPSGYGKSTLGQLMSGYLRPNSGKILVDGEDIEKLQGFLKVQMIHQHPEKSINPNWKVSKILNEGWNVSEEVIKSFGIKDFWLRNFPNELSGGELQRICIARVMHEDTKYLVADEITSMLDAITQVKLLEELINYVRQRKIGMLFISHNYALIDKISDRIIDLKEINKR